MKRTERRTFEVYLNEIDNQIAIAEKNVLLSYDPAVTQENREFISAMEAKRTAIFEILEDLGLSGVWLDGYGWSITPLSSAIIV